MTDTAKRYTGGCLCGAVRYEAEGAPQYAGHCYCADCRKASGSGFIPFMNFPASAVRFSGRTLQFSSKSARGTDAVRNSCPKCGSLVFGGIVGQDDFPHQSMPGRWTTRRRLSPPSPSLPAAGRTGRSSRRA